jgi:hypothetical protein
MKKFLSAVLLLMFTAGFVFSQGLPDLKLSDKKNSLQYFAQNKNFKSEKSFLDKSFQLKTRKTVTSYFGAGYSFIIFTASNMNKAYPVLNFSSGDFLSEINIFYGFSIAKAVTLEFEPSILFTRNNRAIHIELKEPLTVGGSTYTWAHPNSLSMLAFPLAVNFRFFPLFKLKSFGRLFFIGGGAGAIWIREEYDNYYNNSPAGYLIGENYYFNTESTSQWQPLLRVMAGFTGAGGAFGFGGEIRYNIIPLTGSNETFITRYSPNYNSVDLTLRFYFGL